MATFSPGEVAMAVAWAERCSGRPRAWNSSLPAEVLRAENVLSPARAQRSSPVCRH